MCMCNKFTYHRVGTVSTVTAVAGTRETYLSVAQLQKLANTLIRAAIQTTDLAGSTVGNRTLQHCGIN